MTTRQMTAKQFLAGLVTHIIFRIQMVTSGKVGFYSLHSKLWDVYTDNCKITRAGFPIDIGWKKY